MSRDKCSKGKSLLSPPPPPRFLEDEDCGGGREIAIGGEREKGKGGELKTTVSAPRREGGREGGRGRLFLLPPTFFFEIFLWDDKKTLS